MGESAGIVKVDAGGPLNRVQVLCGSSVAGGVLSVAREGSSLREHPSRSESKEAAKQNSDVKANAASALPKDIACPNKHEIPHNLYQKKPQPMVRGEPRGALSVPPRFPVKSRRFYVPA